MRFSPSAVIQVTALSCDDSGVPDSWRTPTPGLPHSVVIRLADPLFERRGRTIDQATRDTLTQHLPKDAMATARELFAKADAVHIHGAWANPNHQLARLAERLKVPYVISPHGMLDDWSMAQGGSKKRLHLALIGRRTLNRARAIHCTASAELQQASKHFPKGRGVVIPLLFDTSQFASLQGPGEARGAFAAALTTQLPTLLFLSRLHVKKGVETLIDAAAVLSRRGRPVNLVLAGPSDPPEYIDALKVRAAAAGIASSTHFVGMVGGSAKWSLYQAADLFVLPTSQENFGYVLLESLACGTPVITTKGVDIWPELQESGGAIITDREPDAIADSVTRLLADPDRPTEMGRVGRAWALTHLDSESTVTAMEKMYRGE